MEVKDAGVRRCSSCKRLTMEVKATFGGDHIIGYECSGCGVRRAYGDPYAPAGAWPKAQGWAVKQKIRRRKP